MLYRVQYREYNRWVQSENFYAGPEEYRAIPRGPAINLRKCQANKYMKFKTSKNQLEYRVEPM